MRKLEANIEIKEGGELYIFHRDKFLQLLKMMPPCRGTLTIEKNYKRNSREQRGYYRGCLINYYILGAWEQQGRIISNAQAHEELKANCNYEEWYDDKTGSVMRTIKSTEGSTVEKEDYLQRCRNFIFEWFGITVPLPNEQGELFDNPNDLKKQIKLIQSHEAEQKNTNQKSVNQR